MPLKVILAQPAATVDDLGQFPLPTLGEIIDKPRSA